MAKTKAVARNIHNRTVTGYGDKPRKRESEVAEERLYGTLDRHIPNFRLLPVDDPLRVHIETTYGCR